MERMGEGGKYKPFSYRITEDGLMLLAAERLRVAEEEQQRLEGEVKEDEKPEMTGAKLGNQKQATGGKMRGVAKKAGAKK